MSVKWSIFKVLFSMDMNVKRGMVAKALMCVLLVLGSAFGQAQEARTIKIEPRRMLADTVFLVKYDTVWLEKEKETDSTYVSERKPSRYDNRVHRYRKHWESFIPTHLKLQFAGNMGLLSLGTGWDYGKRNQWETDILFGYLPKYHSKRSKITMTLKQNYMPWSFDLNEHFSVEPLTCGIYLNTVFGDEFWTNEPERYPEGYYGFSSRMRIHVFLGQRVTYEIPTGFRFGARAATFFYEISTCDLYVVSAFVNKYLKPKDYLSLSFGVKLQLL